MLAEYPGRKIRVRQRFCNGWAATVKMRFFTVDEHTFPNGFKTVDEHSTQWRSSTVLKPFGNVRCVIQSTIHSISDNICQSGPLLGGAQSGARRGCYNLKCTSHIWIWPGCHQKGSFQWTKFEYVEASPLLITTRAHSSYRTLVQYSDLFWGHFFIFWPAICLYRCFLSFPTIFWMVFVQISQRK